MSFVPEFQGQITLEHLPDDFVERLVRRVETGLLVTGRHDRADYRVLSSDRESITFGAQGFLTTYNIGLNRVTIRRAGARQLDYEVSFWGWTGYAVAHGAVMGLLFLALFTLIPEMRRQIGTFPHGTPIFWGIVGFFSLLWPWILTALHRGAARRALERILRDTMTGVGGEVVARLA